jgi:hypothetical protein
LRECRTQLTGRSKLLKVLLLKLDLKLCSCQATSQLVPVGGLGSLLKLFLAHRRLKLQERLNLSCEWLRLSPRRV